MNLDTLRAYCASLPGTTEEIKWDHLTFCVAGKLYIITGFEDDAPLTFKIPPEEFDELTARDGIIQAPHMAKGQWVCITRRGVLRREEWEHYLRQSYDMVKAKLPKKVRESL
jgi:predicted DNA-binding protein (MmcQ/YjbR family)